MIMFNKNAHASHPIEHLLFRPARGLASPHLQTVVATLLANPGLEPPSEPFFIPLDDGDVLHCVISTPPFWQPVQKTVVFVHGLGGSHMSGYMIRMSRKFYHKGYRVLRMNLRGTELDTSFIQRPYHGGLSRDVLQTIQKLKSQTPQSPILLIGFSLGGNIALKLIGELGESANGIIEKTIAVCPPIDLAQTTKMLLKPWNRFYNRYYVRGLQQLGGRWIGNRPIRSIIDFDNIVTAPQWGFRDAYDYYRQCSSCYILSEIRHPCHVIFAVDDPFVDYRSALQPLLPPSVKIHLSAKGGHMGFLGWAGKEHGYFWLDQHLLSLAT